MQIVRMLLIGLLLTGCSSNYVTQEQYKILINDLNYQFAQHAKGLQVLAENQKEAGILKDKKEVKK